MPILDHVKIAQKLRELGFEPVEGSFLGEGEANIGANVGNGTGLVYRDKTGVTLNFRTIKEDPANPGMIITTDGDTILLGTPAGTGNVVGTPPSVADGVATYDGTTGLLIDGPDTKILTVLEPLSETPPFNLPAQYIQMRTSEGSDWAEVIRYAISGAGSTDNNLRLGHDAKLNGRDSTISLYASKDPLVNIIGETFGKMIHEGMQLAWEIRKEGTISQLTGADTAILTLKNGNGTTFTVVKFKAGNILPEGNVNGANGDRYYYKDSSTPANSTEYIFRGSSPGLTGWEELGGGGGVTAHSALTGLVAPADDHTQYALLAGRTGGQELTGGDGTADSLELKATSGVGSAGSNIDFKVGDDGDTLALRLTYDGKFGVGVTDPGELFDIGGVMTINSAGKIRFEQPPASDYDAFAFGEGPTVDTFTLQALLAGSGDNNTLNFKSGVQANILTMTAVNGRVGIKKATPEEVLHVGGNAKLDGDIILYLGGTILSGNYDITLNPGTENVVVDGKLKYDDGFQGTGRIATCNDSAGTVKWLNPNSILERTANYTATVLDRTIICEDILTVTLPVTGIEDGHKFIIKNAVGVTYGSGDTGDVTVSITGSTVKFDKTSSNSKTLTADGWVLVCQWSSSASTYWVTQFSLETTTGTPPPPE